MRVQNNRVKMTEKWREIQGKLDLIQVFQEFELSEFELSGFNCIWTLQFMHNDILWPHFLKSV